MANTLAHIAVEDVRSTSLVLVVLQETLLDTSVILLDGTDVIVVDCPTELAALS